MPQKEQRDRLERRIGHTRDGLKAFKGGRSKYTMRYYRTCVALMRIVVVAVNAAAARRESDYIS